MPSGNTPSSAQIAAARHEMLHVGCAAMTQGECLSENWSRVGYDDGATVYPSSRLGNHEQACASHGLGVDVHAYMQAREHGLQTYCTPQLRRRLSA